MFAPIQLFLEQNDIVLNWKKLANASTDTTTTDNTTATEESCSEPS